MVHPCPPGSGPFKKDDIVERQDRGITSLAQAILPLGTTALHFLTYADPVWIARRNSPSVDRKLKATNVDVPSPLTKSQSSVLVIRAKFYDYLTFFIRSSSALKLKVV